MAVFEYVALDLKGKKVRGFVEAGTPREAREKVRELQLSPLEIIISREILKRKRVEKRISREDLALMTRQLSSLLKSGVPLVEAINSLGKEFSGHPLEKILADISSELKGGKSFSEALKIHSQIFPPFYINMVRTAEETGELDRVLNRVATLLFREVSFQNKVKNALAYPMVVLGVGSIVLFVLLWKVVPSLSKLFEEFNYPLPLITQFLIDFSEISRRWGVWILGSLIMLILLFLFFHRKWGEKLEEIKFRIPLLGKIFQRITLTNFSFLLSSLLKGGVPFLEALSLTRPILKPSSLRKFMEEVEKKVRKGESFSQALKGNSFFPSLLLRMVEVGEKGGNLEEMLEESSRIYEEETEFILHRFILLLEPMVILGIGAIVGFIVISVLLPIFEINEILLKK